MISSSPWSRVVEFFTRFQNWILGAIGVLVMLDVVWMGGSYLFYPGYLDHGESSIALISWRLLDSVPAYTAFDAPGRIGNVYGPVTYLLNAFFNLLSGNSVPAGKAASIAAAILLPALLFFDHRRHGFSTGALALILGAAFVLFTIPLTLFNRPDSFLALLVAGAVWVKNASEPGKPEWGKTVLMGAIGGLAVSLKIHGGIYVAPVALVFCMYRGRAVRPFLYAAALVAGVAILVALLPFALPLFALGNYISWFGPLAGKPEPFLLLTRLLRYSVLYVVPVGVLFALSRKQRKIHDRLGDRTYFGAYLGCLAVAIIMGSKPGAGIHYMFPFFPIAVDLIFRHGRGMGKRKDMVWAAIGFFAVLMLALGMPVQKRYQRALHWKEAEQITADLGSIMAAHPGKTVEMGLGDDVTTYYKTWYKSLLVLSGHPYTLDGGVVMEAAFLKIPLTDDTIAMIRGCNTDIWLIPKGQRPFEMIGYYGVPVFDENFKKAFFDNYEKWKESAFFDLWACKRRDG